VPAVRLAIFLLTYVLIAVETIPGVRLNRPAASLLGAVAMVALGGLSPREAYAAIDLDVIVFLLGLLLISAYLELGSFFDWAAYQIVRHTRSPSTLLAALVGASGLLAALFINDTVCLVFTPVVILALRPLGLRPQPYLLAIALGSNVGSAATIIGNPQNMLIGVTSGISFARFSLMLLPAVLGALACVYGVLALVYRNELKAELRHAADGEPPALDRPLVVTVLVVFGAAVIAWLAGLSLPLVSITAGAVVIALARRDAAAAFANVEWSLLLFFASLFVVVQGVRDLPLFEELTSRAAGLLTGAPLRDAAVMTGAMTALSNLVSNVPAVLLWLPVMPRVTDAHFIWLVMAMSATFAGNLTLVASMANLIVAERAAARGVRLRFGEYFRVGLPVTALTLGWGIVTLLAMRALFA